MKNALRKRTVKARAYCISALRPYARNQQKTNVAHDFRAFLPRIRTEIITVPGGRGAETKGGQTPPNVVGLITAGEGRGRGRGRGSGGGCLVHWLIHVCQCPLPLSPKRGAGP